MQVVGLRRAVQAANDAAFYDSDVISICASMIFNVFSLFVAPSARC
jgi:hypothetical protein